MILLKALGLVDKNLNKDQIELGDSLSKIEQELLDGAEAMLRGGVFLSAQDWIDMTAQERAAFIKAGTFLRDELALMIMKGILNPAFQADLMAPYDQGASKREFLKHNAFNALLNRMDELSNEYKSNIYVNR